MQTKIILSEEELGAIANKRFFEVKKEVSGKVQLIFSEVLKDETLNEGWNKILVQYDKKILEGKISKGENYLGLPWLLLDSPRQFSNDDVFAVRNFFWWGNYFACYFLLSGKSLEKYFTIILKNHSLLDEKKLFLSIKETEWNHEVNEKNYLQLNEKNISELKSRVQQLGYLKLAAVHSINEFENAASFFIEQQKFFQKIISE